MEPFLEEQDLDAALREIPPEYQEVFRQALQRELVESEQNRTDQEILRYLRRRREDIRRGAYIRPDGQPDALTLSPEALYEQALPALARSGEREEGDDRRRTLLVAGGLLLGALLLLALALRGRAARAAGEPVPTPTTVAATAASPTPALPLVAGVDESLETIGGLGGALTIGRPSAIALTYRAAGETIALAIDPSRPTARGELRYDPAVMASENPVAVWLFGTVLNYAVGVPAGLVANLAPGDTITLSSDTGAALHFVVRETATAAIHDAGRLLSQDRVGLTLFSLPAPGPDAVAVAFAAYDLRAEAAAAPPAFGVGERAPLGEDGFLRVDGVVAGQEEPGTLRIVISGAWEGPEPPLLSLAGGAGQTDARPLAPDGAGGWVVTFTLPEAASGQPLTALFRPPAGGAPVRVALGVLPDPAARLETELAAARWAAGALTLDFTLFNPGPGAALLAPADLTIFDQGGNAYELSGQTTPPLPLILQPDERRGLVVTVRPHDASVRVQVGAALWEVGGLPVAADPASPPDGR